MFKQNPSGEMAGDEFLKWCDRTGHDIAKKVLNFPYIFTSKGEFQFLRQLCGKPDIDIKYERVDTNQIKIYFYAYDKNKKLCSIFYALFIGKYKAYCEVK